MLLTYFFTMKFWQLQLLFYYCKFDWFCHCMGYKLRMSCGKSDFKSTCVVCGVMGCSYSTAEREGDAYIGLNRYSFKLALDYSRPLALTLPLSIFCRIPLIYNCIFSFFISSAPCWKTDSLIRINWPLAPSSISPSSLVMFYSSVIL